MVGEVEFHGIDLYFEKSKIPQNRALLFAIRLGFRVGIRVRVG